MLAQPLYHHDSAMKQPWRNHEANIEATITQPWRTHNTAITQPRNSHDAIMTQPWHNHKTTQPWRNHETYRSADTWINTVLEKFVLK